MDENQIAKKLLDLLRQNPNIDLGEAIQRSGVNIDRSRITQFRHYRSDEEVRRALKLLVPTLIESLSLCVPALIEQNKLQKGLSFLSLLYSTFNNNLPAKCACAKKWKRVQRRCYPICRGNVTGGAIYPTLEACQAAPEPPWPDPAGQDNGRGGGGYWRLWVGHKRVVAGGSVPNTWTGGTFYESTLDYCATSGYDYVNHYAPRSYVLANPGEYPGSSSISGGTFEYFSLPMVPQINQAAYGTPAMLSGFKNTTLSSGVYKVSPDGWFYFHSFNNDVFLLGENGEYDWLNPDNISFGFCAVGKYVRVEDNDDVTPPSSIDGSNCTGVTPFHDPTREECGDLDPTCRNPSTGNPVRECPFPQDRRAYQIWVGGSKETPIEVSRVHFDDSYDGYIVANGARVVENKLKSNEIIKIFSRSSAEEDWCKIEAIQIADTAITKTEFKNPELPTPRGDDWKQSIAIYNKLAPVLETNFPTGNPSVDKYRDNKQANIIFQKNLVLSDLGQKIYDAEVNQPRTFEQVINKTSLKNQVSVCFAPFVGESSDTQPTKGWVIPQVYKIHAEPIKTLGATAWIERAGEAYELARLSCDRVIKQYCEKVLLVGAGDSTPFSISIGIKPGATFTGSGKVEVWRTNSNSPSVLDRIWVGQSLSTTGGIDLKFPFEMPWYDGMFFICRNPDKGDTNDTCVISWDFPSLTVTLEGF